MDRPFRELHELWKILYNKAEAEAARQKAEKDKEEEERKAKERADINRGAKPPQINRQPPADAMKLPTNNSNVTPSPLEAEAFEDMLEEFVEGGVM